VTATGELRGRQWGEFHVRRHPAFPESPVELSALEAAEFLRVEPNTIYHEAAADRLPAWKEGQEWRTSASALRQYLSSDPDPSGRYVRNGAQDKQ